MNPLTTPKPGSIKLTIQCAGCQRTQVVRSSKIVPCDGYFCGACGFQPPSPPEGHVTTIILYAAGSFYGYRAEPADPDTLAAIQRAKAIQEAGLALLKKHH